MKKKLAAAGEFIGKKVKIISSKNKYCENIEGKIIDETKNILKIKTNKGEMKKLVKKENVFLIGNEKISGKTITSRPEERIKKWLKNKMQKK